MHNCIAYFRDFSCINVRNLIIRNYYKIRRCFNAFSNAFTTLTTADEEPFEIFDYLYLPFNNIKKVLIIRFTHTISGTVCLATLILQIRSICFPMITQKCSLFFKLLNY